MKKHTLVHKSRRFRRFVRANKAVSALEYAILIGVIAAALGGALVAFGGNITGAIAAFGAKVTAAGAAAPAIPTAPPAPF